MNNKLNFIAVLKECIFIQIVVDNNTRSVTGVEFVRNNKLEFVQVQKEVILSAGSFGSPQILMLSGIGPRSHLEEKGVSINILMYLVFLLVFISIS